MRGSQTKRHQYTFVGRSKGRLVWSGIDKDHKNAHVTLPRVRFNPEVYHLSDTPSEYSTIDGQPLERYEYDSVESFFRQINDLKEDPNVYGMKAIEYQYINQFHQNREHYDTSLVRTCYFDIEASRDKDRGYASPSNPFSPVTMITAFMPWEHTDGRIRVWMLRRLESTVFRNDPTVRVFNDELTMISDFFTTLRIHGTDVLTGWNVENYDIPYLCGRLLGLYDGAPTERQEGYTKRNGSFYLEGARIGLTPFNEIRRRTTDGAFGTKQLIFEIPGWSTLDYYKIYRKFATGTKESYTLDFISHCELGEKKVDYSEYQHLQELMEKNYPKYVEYARKDTMLVYRLEQKLHFLDLTYTMAYMVGCNFTDIYSPVKTWEVYLYHEMSKTGLVPPFNKSTDDKRDPFAGAFVMDPLRGKSDWVVSLDLASLYPHIMMFCNMSPETYIKEQDMTKEEKTLHDKMKSDVQGSIQGIVNHQLDTSPVFKRDLTLTPNGAMYDKTRQGIIPQMLKDVYVTRKKVKKDMLRMQQELENIRESGGEDKELDGRIMSAHAKQLSLKILLNSCYGCMGNSHFMFFNLDTALGITSMGQTAIQYIAKVLTDHTNDLMKTPDKRRVAYSDTDSLFFILDDVADTFKRQRPDLTDDQITNLLDRFCNDKIQPEIDAGYERLRQYLNGYEQSLKMKREKIARSIIFVQKKRYTAAVIDNEGVRYDHPKIMTTGLESVRSTTPMALRQRLRQLEKVLLLGTKEDAIQYVTKTRVGFHNMLIEDIAIVKTVNDISKWVHDMENWTNFKPGIPMQVRAAAIYNRIMLRNDPHAELIKSGDKIHLVMLKKCPAFDMENCVAYPQMIRPELGLTKGVVDWDAMFDKTFMAGASILMTAMGIDIKAPVAVSLAAFFS